MQAARLGSVTLQVERDWVLRFNAAEPPGLVDHKALGQPLCLCEEHRAALAAMIAAGPTPVTYGVVGWRLIDRGQRLWKEFRLSMSKQMPRRELCAMAYRKPWVGRSIAHLRTAVQFRRITRARGGEQGEAGVFLQNGGKGHQEILTWSSTRRRRNGESTHRSFSCKQARFHGLADKSGKAWTESAGGGGEPPFRLDLRTCPSKL